MERSRKTCAHPIFCSVFIMSFLNSLILPISTASIQISVSNPVKFETVNKISFPLGVFAILLAILLVYLWLSSSEDSESEDEDSKPVKCPKCEKRFKNRHVLNTHLRTVAHTEEEKAKISSKNTCQVIHQFILFI